MLAKLINRIPIVIRYYPASWCSLFTRRGYAIHKWQYGSRSSWRHGNAYIGPIKVTW